MSNTEHRRRSTRPLRFFLYFCSFALSYIEISGDRYVTFAWIMTGLTLGALVVDVGLWVTRR